MDIIPQPQVEEPPAWVSTFFDQNKMDREQMPGAIIKISEDMKNANKTGGVTKQLTNGTAGSSTGMLNNGQGIVSSAVEKSKKVMECPNFYCRLTSTHQEE